MNRLLRLGSKVIVVDDYDQLREVLQVPWSLTRLRRTTGSMHHNDRCLKISRKGEPMRDEDRPFQFVVTGRLPEA